MSCKICGRNNCAKIFHSIEEQQKFDEQYGEYESEIDELKDKIEWLEKAYDILYGYLTDEQTVEAEKEIKQL